MPLEELPPEPILAWNPPSGRQPLFHYTKIGTIPHFIDGSLRLSRFSLCNDPTEFAPIRSLQIRMNSLAQMPRNIQFKEQLELARNNGHVACFSRCPTGYGIAPMWAHYATGPNPASEQIEPHRGCCVAFCFDSLVAELSSQFGDSFAHDYVTYRQTDYEPGIGINLADGENIHEIARDYVKNNLWFRKNNCWQYESEYRMIVCDQPDDFVYLSLADSIIAIFAGCNCTTDELETILRYGKTLGLADRNLNIVVWDRGVPSIESIQHKLDSNGG
jgi:hypothetical protein